MSILFKNLKKLSIDLYINVEEEESIETIENNKCLTHFTIFLYIYDSKSEDAILRHMTALDQLVYLKMIHPVNNQLINGFRQLSIKCLKLKSLSIQSFGGSSALIWSFVTQVKRFKRLERLGFEFFLEIYKDFKPFNEYFKGMESLTHLRDNFMFGNHIENDLLKDIDICLPKLRVLCLRNFSLKVSEQTIDSLGRLSTLQSLELNVNNIFIRESIVNKVEKNCKNIKTIIPLLY